MSACGLCPLPLIALYCLQQMPAPPDLDKRLSDACIAIISNVVKVFWLDNLICYMLHGIGGLVTVTKTLWLLTAYVARLC